MVCTVVSTPVARKVKIAVSIAPDVLALLDRHAGGRSRSQCVEDELRRALRAREWEKLAEQTTAEDAAEQEEWALSSLVTADEALARDERPKRHVRRRTASR